MKKPINPNDLIQNILKIMDAQITKMSKLEEFTEQQLKMLPDMLRVLLAASKSEKQDEDEVKTNLANLSTKQLEAMLDK